MGTSGLGPLLVAEGLLSETDRRTIKKACGMAGAAFARSIVALGLLDEDELASFLADRTSWTRAPKNLLDASDNEAIGAIDRLLLERLEALPLKLSDGILEVAVTDPLDHDTLRQLAFFSGYRIVPVIATLSQIRQGLKHLYKGYRPPSLHLEQFLANHATAASRRIQLQDKRRKPPSFAPPPLEPPRQAQADVTPSMTEEDDEPFAMPPPLRAEMPTPAAAPASVAAPDFDAPLAASDDAAEQIEDLFMDDIGGLPAETGEPEEAPMAAADSGLELDFDAEAAADLGALDDLDAALADSATPTPPLSVDEDAADPFGDIAASGTEAAADDRDADLAADLLSDLEAGSAAMPEVTTEDDLLSAVSGADAPFDVFSEVSTGPSSAGPDIDLGNTDASDAAAHRAASLNRAMLDLTMAADCQQGVRAVAPALSAAGLTRGLTLESDGGGGVIPIAMWQPQAQGVAVKSEGLRHFITPGLRDALGRLFPGWTPLSDAVRNDDLAPLAEWSDAATELMATMAPSASGKQLIVLASWQHELLKDDGLKKQTLDVVRKLAKKL